VKGRLAAGIAAVLLFAALSAGAVLLAGQNARLHAQVGGLHAQVTILIVQRNARHAAFCRYLHGVATDPGIPPALARLAAATVRPEGCAT
jgi:hypothetical protein